MDYSKKVLVEARGICKSYDKKVVLKDVNFLLKQEESVVILGKSGIGKTVFLKILLGLEKPDSGCVFLFGEDINRLKEYRLTQLRTKIAIIFQEGALFDFLRVWENVGFFLIEKLRMREERVRQVVRDILAEVNLFDVEDLYPHQLSFGMRKRVAIARSLIYKPSVIFLDEPTASLDPPTARGIIKLILDLKKKFNITLLSVTHDEYTAKSLAKDGIYLLSDGNLQRIQNTFL